MTIFASGKAILAYSNFNVFVSRNTALSFFPMADINWSMIPQLQPLKLFSLYCPLRAMATLSKFFKSYKSRNMTPVKTSMLALELNPAPAGMFPQTHISNPTGNVIFFCVFRAQTTPKG